MKYIETNNITLVKDTETQEAMFIYDKAKIKYMWIYIIPLILLIIQFVFLFTTQLDFFIFFSTEIIIISLVIMITCISIYKKMMKPYKELLNIAKKNDLIRHEEEIRFKERERLIKNKSITKNKN